MVRIARSPVAARPAPREVFVLDARRARRLLLSRTPRGSLHVEELDRLQESWDEKQHQRPSMLSARGRSFASTSHEREERRQRFAREVARWLRRAVASGRGIPVLCPTPLLGALRDELGSRLAARLELRACDLGWLNLRELAGHAAIAGLLPRAAAD